MYSVKEPQSMKHDRLKEKGKKYQQITLDQVLSRVNLTHASVVITYENTPFESPGILYRLGPLQHPGLICQLHPALGEIFNQIDLCSRSIRVRPRIVFEFLVSIHHSSFGTPARELDNHLSWLDGVHFCDWLLTIAISCIANGRLGLLHGIGWLRNGGGWGLPRRWATSMSSTASAGSILRLLLNRVSNLSSKLPGVCSGRPKIRINPHCPCCSRSSSLVSRTWMSERNSLIVASLWASRPRRVVSSSVFLSTAWDSGVMRGDMMAWNLVTTSLLPRASRRLNWKRVSSSPIVEERADAVLDDLRLDFQDDMC